jgi:hypothetical protein
MEVFDEPTGAIARGCRDETKRKTNFCRADIRPPVVFPVVIITVFGSVNCYPAVLENKEENKTTLLDQYNFCFGP